MPRSDAVRALLFGAAAFALFLVTLAPGVYWGDSGRLQNLTHSPEFSTGARGYPLWTGAAHLLYRFLPVEPAAAANLFAALCGAVAVVLAWHLARRETGRPDGADVAAAALAVSHLFWSSSVVAEVYSLSAVFVLLLLLLARPAASGRTRPAFAFGALVALCFLHHRTLLALGIVLGLSLLVHWLRRGLRLRPVGAALLGFALGLLPFLVLAVFGPGQDSLSIGRILLGSFHTVPPAAAEVPGLLAYEAGFLAFNLAGPQLLLLVIGIIHALRVRTPGALGLLAVCAVGLLLPFLFANAGDRYIFMLPAFVAAPVLAGLGATRLCRRWSGRLGPGLLLTAVAVFPPATYAALARFVSPENIGRFHQVDPRHVSAFLWPGKSGSHDAADTAVRIFAALPPGATLFHRWGEGQVLLYLQHVDHRRPDVTLIPVGRPRGPESNGPIEEGTAFVSAYPFLPAPGGPFPIGPAIIPGCLWPIAQP